MRFAGNSVSPSADGTNHTTNADDRVYELSNHPEGSGQVSGNVLATFTARKLPVEANGVFTGFSPHVTSLTDYYPFGSGMEGRTVTEGYRYGFNAMEREDDLYAPGSAYDFGARMYDGRLGRWWSVDFLQAEYPSQSPFAFALNTPITLRDEGGDIVVDSKGNPVTIRVSINESGLYTATFSFVDGSDQAVIDDFEANGGYIIRSMIQVPSGQEMVTGAMLSRDKIHYNLDPGSSGKRTSLKYGTTKLRQHIVFDELGQPIGAESIIQVFVFLGDIELSSKLGLEGFQANSMKIEEDWRASKLSLEQKVGTVAIHETFHATNEYDVNELKEGRTIAKHDPMHKPAYEIGERATKEYGELNK